MMPMAAVRVRMPPTVVGVKMRLAGHGKCSA
jgi:hypothetical protein